MDRMLVWAGEGAALAAALPWGKQWRLLPSNGHAKRSPARSYRNVISDRRIKELVYCVKVINKYKLNRKRPHHRVRTFHTT